MLGTNNLPSHSEASLSTFERVANMREHYINQGSFYSRDSGYHPATGDIIFFKYPDGRNHTGIVIAYDEESETVYTVEGNAGDAVRNRSYNITHGDIVGYGSNGGMNNSYYTQHVADYWNVPIQGSKWYTQMSSTRILYSSITDFVPYDRNDPVYLYSYKAYADWLPRGIVPINVVTTYPKEG